jgi:hypothetical protein
VARADRIWRGIRLATETYRPCLAAYGAVAAFPACTVHALFDAAGIEQLTESEIATRQDFSDFEDWWDPWAAGGQGIAGAFNATLPAEHISPIKDIVHRAYLAGGGAEAGLRLRLPWSLCANR